MRFNFSVIFFSGSFIINHPRALEPQEQFVKAIYFTAFSQALTGNSFPFLQRQRDRHVTSITINSWSGAWMGSARFLSIQLKFQPIFQLLVNFADLRCRSIVKYACSRLLKFNFPTNSQLSVEPHQDILVFVEIWFLDWPRVQPKKRAQFSGMCTLALSLRKRKQKAKKIHFRRKISSKSLLRNVAKSKAKSTGIIGRDGRNSRKWSPGHFEYCK